MKKKKRGSKPMIGALDFDERIVYLKEEIARLESVIFLKDYFFKIKNYRGVYTVELRRYFAVKLDQQGFSISEIGRILGKHHSTIIYLLKQPHIDGVTEEINKYAEEWVKEGVYPKSYEVWEPSYLHTQGLRSVVKYKLIKL